MRHIINSLIIIISIISMIILLSFNLQKDKLEKRFYYAFGEKVQIVQVTDKIFVKKKTTLKKSNYEETAKRLLGEIKIKWLDNDISEIELKDLKNKEEKIKNLKSDEAVLSVRNVYKTGDDLEFGFSDEIVLRFNDEIKDSEKREILNTFNLKKSKTTKIYDLVTVSKNEDIIEVANKLYESGSFEFAYPNIICKAELFSTIPNDPYFQFQVTCHNTGQTFNGHSGTPDADIDAPEAWDITTGSNNIVIAVFDEGVTSDHPDLPNTRQVRLDDSNFGAGDANDPSPIGDDNHGNSCAGVIGATMNNNQGIAGIAPNCRIMPLRWDGTTISNEMADGIEFAVDHGANIISNSWGYSTSNNNYIPAIVTAIQYAINNNVVVIFAAGNTARHNSCNDNGYVTFPANANVTGLLTVGASDRSDIQSDYSPTSSLIDIVAPSHRAYPPEAYSPNCGGISGETLEMWTIDIPGDAGYNTWPSTGIHPPSTGETLPNTETNYLSYTGRFGGTSHACPVVAGVAALLLSCDPNLNPQEVFNILTSTADEIGGYTYTNGRCNQTGYGRVNAFAAVQAACIPIGIWDKVTIEDPPENFPYFSENSMIFTPGETLNYYASFESAYGDTWANSWLWEIILYHSVGTYLYASASSLPDFGNYSWWQFTSNASLPDYDWSRDQLGNIYGTILARSTDNNGDYNYDEKPISVIYACSVISIKDLTYYNDDATISCSNINIENVTIQNNSNVIFDYSEELSIENNFEVEIGSSVEIK